MPKCSSFAPQGTGDLFATKTGNVSWMLGKLQCSSHLLTCLPLMHVLLPCSLMWRLACPFGDMFPGMTAGWDVLQQVCGCVHLLQLVRLVCGSVRVAQHYGSRGAQPQSHLRALCRAALLLWAGQPAHRGARHPQHHTTSHNTTPRSWSPAAARASRPTRRPAGPRSRNRFAII